MSLFIHYLISSFSSTSRKLTQPSQSSSSLIGLLIILLFQQLLDLSDMVLIFFLQGVPPLCPSGVLSLALQAQTDFTGLAPHPLPSVYTQMRAHWGPFRVTVGTWPALSLIHSWSLRCSGPDGVPPLTTRNTTGCNTHHTRRQLCQSHCGTTFLWLAWVQALLWGSLGTHIQTEGNLLQYDGTWAFPSEDRGVESEDCTQLPQGSEYPKIQSFVLKKKMSY